MFVLCLLHVHFVTCSTCLLIYFSYFYAQWFWAIFPVTWIRLQFSFFFSKHHLGSGDRRNFFMCFPTMSYRVLLVRLMPTSVTACLIQSLSLCLVWFLSYARCLMTTVQNSCCHFCFFLCCIFSVYCMQLHITTFVFAHESWEWVCVVC